MKKGIAILGSTGSIGVQALEVVEANADRFSVEVITANTNWKLLAEQAQKFKPNTVVIVDDTHYQELKDLLWDEDIKVYAGKESLSQVVAMDSIDLVLTALVGYAGLKPTLVAIEAGKNIALANKETLVVAGDIVIDLAKEKGVNIYPVDSEHSAIFQCLAGEFHNPIEKIVLTASGGPFRQKTLEELKSVTVKQALKHPNWEMGAKITIDSASLMNKGLEVIEAKWLFDLKAEQIEVIVHPQSIIHSIVQFQDGSMKAQMGLPDMKLPIQYALAYPERIENDFPRFSFSDFASLTFEAPDTERFINLKLAYDTIEKGGNAACVLNAANEVTNEEFRAGKISFLEIGEINQECLEKSTFISKPSYEDYVASHKEAQAISKDLIGKKIG